MPGLGEFPSQFDPTIDCQSPEALPEIIKPTYVILAGASGAGKTSIMRGLRAIDPRFVAIPLITDRPSRGEEEERQFVTREEFATLYNGGELAHVFARYGFLYGLNRSHIQNAFAEGKIPIGDFPLDEFGGLEEFTKQLFCIYVAPPSLDVLQGRLQDSGRDPSGSRFEMAQWEIPAMKENGYVTREVNGGFVINDDLATATLEVLEKIYARITGLSDTC